MSRRRRPKADVGTVVLHLLMVVSFLILLATGLRIASDDPAARWLVFLDAILPAEHVWYRHLAGGLLLIATLSAYAIYLMRARLTARITFDAARARAVLRPGRGRRSALAVAITCLLLASLAVEVITGIALFLEFGGPTLSWHLFATWCCLACIAAHVTMHYAIGGLDQLSRIIRPTRLVVAPPAPDLASLLAEQLQYRSGGVTAHTASYSPAPTPPDTPPGTPSRRPLLTAGTIALAAILVCVIAERATRQTLMVTRVDDGQAPKLDGDLADPAWAKAAPITIATSAGGDFGGTGQSLVEVRAVHDSTFAYFSFVWTDPTRSLQHNPLTKTASGWSMGAQDATTTPFEDKFAVLLARSTLPLIGAAIHLSAAKRSDGLQGLSGRGLHYTTDGTIGDVWVWRASHAGRVGLIDNCSFGPPSDSLAASTPPRYTGGFAVDPGQPDVFAQNIDAQENADVSTSSPGSHSLAVRPLRLPRDVPEIVRRADAASTPTSSDDAYARSWMTPEESMPYSAQVDALIPVGTVIPNIVLLADPTVDKTSVRGVGRWAAGRWTLELARRLDTGSAFDLPIETGSLMWVAAFDHSLTRHTRHLRPLHLEVE